jgi:hypothetical protein
VFRNGTIDHRVESLNGEKTDSVELALDDRLVGERSEHVNLAELFQIACTALKLRQPIAM